MNITKSEANAVYKIINSMKTNKEENETIKRLSEKIERHNLKFIAEYHLT